MDGQVRALGEVLAQQSVGVLVDPALAGLMRVAEVDLDAGVHLHGLPVLHFDALVPGQGMAQRFGQGLDLRGQCVAHLLGLVVVGKMDEHRVVGVALHEGPDGGLVALADDVGSGRSAIPGLLPVRFSDPPDGRKLREGPLFLVPEAHPCIRRDDWPFCCQVNERHARRDPGKSVKGHRAAI